jgi:hypothetical protein
MPCSSINRSKIRFTRGTTFRHPVSQIPVRGTNVADQP